MTRAVATLLPSHLSLVIRIAAVLTNLCGSESIHAEYCGVTHLATLALVVAGAVLPGLF